ncbi:LysR family transcriptional regulator [Burkholderia sp. AU29985]|nr:LysR family transcriptional regulator [Burkholderia dolosa]PRE51073.1 LysR family transcriptional regulator [Burkholderia sp. AU12872]PUA75405.1 LysR family transcriptional regulator [Burkholderia sp. AU29985]
MPNRFHEMICTLITFSSSTGDPVFSSSRPHTALPKRLHAEHASLPSALRKLRIRDLEMLACLGRNLSIGRTAEAAAISQPALSKWLKDIEGALGASLFERTTRRMTTTPCGELVLTAVERILTELRKVPPRLEAMQSGIGRTLALGIIPGASHVIVPPILRWSTRRYGELQIHVNENTFDVLLRQLQRHELDLLVCRLDANALNSEFRVRRLYDDEFTIVCGPDHPLLARSDVTWRDAAEFPWIAPASGAPARVAIETEFAHAGLRMPPVVMESHSLQTNIAVARQIPCLFVTSRASVAAHIDVPPLDVLPLRLSHAASAIGAMCVDCDDPMIDATIQAILQSVRSSDADSGIRA